MFANARNWLAVGIGGAFVLSAGTFAAYAQQAPVQQVPAQQPQAVPGTQTTVSPSGQQIQGNVQIQSSDGGYWASHWQWYDNSYLPYYGRQFSNNNAGFATPYASSNWNANNGTFANSGGMFGSGTRAFGNAAFSNPNSMFFDRGSSYGNNAAGASAMPWNAGQSARTFDRANVNPYGPTDFRTNYSPRAGMFFPPTGNQSFNGNFGASQFSSPNSSPSPQFFDRANVNSNGSFGAGTSGTAATGSTTPATTNGPIQFGWW